MIVYAFRYYLQMTQKDKESQRSNENVINLLQKSQFMKHVENHLICAETLSLKNSKLK